MDPVGLLEIRGHFCQQLIAGDSDIQFQVPSVAGKINDLLLNKKAETVTMTATIDGETYEGEGYNIEPKKVIGGLFMRSEDRQTALFLPNVEGV